MERVVIHRAGNGVTVEVGQYVVRLSSIGFGKERTIEYGAPGVYLPGEADLGASWPSGMPDPETIESIFGDISGCGRFFVAEFRRSGKFSGGKVIVPREDIPALAQTLANSALVSEPERI